MPELAIPNGPTIGVEILIALLASLVGSVFGSLIASTAAWRQLQRGVFFDQLNMSLNMVEGDTLKLRTLSERPLADIVPNSAARRIMFTAAKAALKNNGDPVLRLPKEHASYIMRCIVNHAAEQFGTGFLRRDCGQAVSSTWYAICLTSEETDRHQAKIRALLIKEQHLVEFPLPKGVNVDLESPKHDVRLQALQQAADLYKLDEHKHLFERIEISL